MLLGDAVFVFGLPPSRKAQNYIRSSGFAIFNSSPTDSHTPRRAFGDRLSSPPVSHTYTPIHISPDDSQLVWFQFMTYSLYRSRNRPTETQESNSSRSPAFALQVGFLLIAYTDLHTSRGAYSISQTHTLSHTSTEELKMSILAYGFLFPLLA